MNPKPKIAIVRGKFLNAYEMQFYEPLVRDFDITAFGSLHPYHNLFAFTVRNLPSPMDLPDFPYKMPVLNRLFTDAHYLLGLEKNLRGFDLVHSAETYYHYTQQCLNAKKRGYVRYVIATVLENIPFNNEGITGRKTFKNRARHELDHIIALTEKTKAALVTEGADARKISVIGHFINCDRFKPAVSFKRQHLAGQAEPIRILYVGRLEIYKGVFDILSAAINLIKQPELKKIKMNFIFAGQGSQSARMNEMIASSQLEQYFTFTYADYDQMPQVYRSAHIFLAPSQPTPTWEEQYNTSLLEAQASGLPIITTRTGGIPENVGHAAVVVSPGDVQAITAALRSFILDPQLRTKYGQLARNRALTVHDARIGAEKIKSLYGKIMHGHN